MLLLLTGLVSFVTGILADDNLSTISTINEPVRLLFGESTGFSWKEAGTSSNPTAIVELRDLEVASLDYHRSKQLLIYSSQEAIWRLSLYDTRQPEVILEGVEMQSSVAVDWTRDLIYWTMPMEGIVQRTILDGNKRSLILTLDQGTKFGNLSNIVLDPYNRFMFLAVDGDRFIRAHIDGEGQASIQPEGLRKKRVVSLAVDISSHRIYVSSRHDHAPGLMSCGYDGTKPMEYDLTNAWWNTFVSIDVYRNQLFWLHKGWQDPDTVWRANMSQDNGSLSWRKEYKAKDTILNFAPNIWTIRVYKPQIPTEIEFSSESEDLSRRGLETLPPPVSPQYSSSSRRHHITSILLVFCHVVYSIIIHNT